MITGFTIQLFIKDIKEAERWYTYVIGRGPDSIPFQNFLEWEVIPGLMLQVTERNLIDSKPLSGRMRFGITDIVSERLKIVKELGAEVSKIEEIPGTVRWCNFNDPWGNKLGYFQDLKKFPVNQDFDMEFK